MSSRRFPLALVLVLLLFGAGAGFPQEQTSNDANRSDTPEDTTSRVFQLVLPSEHLFGNWDGLLPTL
jgi:porin